MSNATTAAYPHEVTSLLEQAAEAERSKAQAYYELQRLAAAHSLAGVLAERDKSGAEGFTLTSSEVADKLYREQPDRTKRQISFSSWWRRHPDVVDKASRGKGRMMRWNWDLLMEAMKQSPKAAGRGQLARVAAKARRGEV